MYSTMSPNLTEPETGYDIPVYGIANGTFYAIHIPALICIVASWICATIAIVLSFRFQGYRQFFKSWNKSERFVVYLALCDGLFNVSHFTDHLHVVLIRGMVQPRALCEFYGFILAEFITAQNLMVNCVAVNAFLLIYFDKNLDFGKRDWRLLLWTFGAPLLGATIAGALGKLGPNGAFCFFDTVRDSIVIVCFTTVPLLIVLVMNIILYILTYHRIQIQTRSSLSRKTRASHRAARAMSLFVVAFFIQWWAMALFGAWSLIGDVPQAAIYLVVTFTNLGGVLNLIVYKIMRYKGFTSKESDHQEQRAPSCEAVVAKATVSTGYESPTSGDTFKMTQ